MNIQKQIGNSVINYAIFNLMLKNVYFFVRFAMTQQVYWEFKNSEFSNKQRFSVFKY
ncbi:hypothetical protein FCR2A7T_26330 [Flavobacterium cauense R2A-7]|nr:hypothetical protein FCR2A7T_26330 [Flavobacterium cauense R2A-7]